MIPLYPAALLIISAVVMAAERFFPWRPEQRQLRRTLPSDIAHLVFNGHFLGVILAAIAVRHVLPRLDAGLARLGVADPESLHLAAAWPLWAQIAAALVITDFLEWCVHNLLHRVPWLWELHKTHHSVVDGEMDWIVSFRFQWTEVVVYKSLKYLPLAALGLGEEAVMTHAIVGTLIGHLNHANLDLGHGRWRYLLNSPRMHIWHHDHDMPGGKTVNFGIIFSVWDWIFGTAYMPAHPPARLGFAGVESFPRNFLAQEAWPLTPRGPTGGAGDAGAAALGAGCLALGAVLAFVVPAASPPAAPSAGRVVGADAAGADPLLLGEKAATSRPARGAATPPGGAAAEDALGRLGATAEAAGFAHPEHLASAPEVRAALGSPRLVLLDARPRERFLAGHIPSARSIDRGDYEQSVPVPGLSVPRAGLEALLRARGVRRGAVVVLYGDGNPEPYRLWWALQVVGGFSARVLDGGLQAWKGLEYPLAEGTGAAPPAGDVVLAGAPAAPALRWDDVSARLDGAHAVLLDTRTLGEFRGEVKHPGAARAGRIPGAVHLDWQDLLAADGSLRRPPELRERFAGAGVDEHSTVVTSCQTGTRSAVAYFALHQLGYPDAQILNYNGSWAEYSRLDLPAVTGDADGPADPRPPRP